MWSPSPTCILSDIPTQTCKQALVQEENLHSIIYSLTNITRQAIKKCIILFVYIKFNTNVLKKQCHVSNFTILYTF